jgi:hypothetical protein
MLQGAGLVGMRPNAPWFPDAALAIIKKSFVEGNGGLQA